MKVTYQSSAPSTAKVDETTGDVEFLKAGTVYVTATMEESKKYKYKCFLYGKQFLEVTKSY